MRLLTLALALFALMYTLGCSSKTTEHEPSDITANEGRNTPLNEETDQVEDVRKQVMGED